MVTFGMIEEVRKIYLVITPFFPTRNSFRGSHIYDQVRAIERTGRYRVIVLKPRALLSRGEDYEYGGVEVKYFNAFDLPEGIFPGVMYRRAVISLKKKLRDLGVELKDVAVVHAHITSYGYFANALKREASHIKSVLQHHGFDVLGLYVGRFCRRPWQRKWVKWFGARVCNHIDLHVGVSDIVFDSFVTYENIRLKNRIVLHNGVDLDKYYPLMQGKNSSVFTIGCIGDFWKPKDQITLIKAGEMLVEQGMTDLHIVFVGYGESLKMCRAYVQSHGLTPYVSFYREISNNELIDYYNSLDMFVLPSYLESFGCVYTEAWACNVPFIAVKNQGIAEMIPSEDQDKWLMNARDVKQLVQMIREYRINGYTQRLTGPIDVNVLVQGYLGALDKLDVGEIVKSEIVNSTY